MLPIKKNSLGGSNLSMSELKNQSHRDAGKMFFDEI
jgi:hypothetical protein